MGEAWKALLFILMVLIILMLNIHLLKDSISIVDDMKRKKQMTREDRRIVILSIVQVLICTAIAFWAITAIVLFFISLGK